LTFDLLKSNKRAIQELLYVQYLKLTDIPNPAVSDGSVLVQTTAAGATQLDHTILSGSYPKARAPLALGNEGAGVMEGSGDYQFPVGSRVMFTGPLHATRFQPGKINTL
jgi:NADPH2:quinone reductase